MKKILRILIALLFIPSLCFAGANSVMVSFVPASGGGGTPTLSFVDNSSTSGSFATTLTLSVPSGTSDGDIMIASVSDDTDHAVTCSGWTEITNDSVTSSRNTVFYRIASSEPASYDFTTSASSVKAGNISTFEKTGGTWDIEAYSSVVTDVGNTTLTSTAITTTNNSIYYTSWSNDGSISVTTGPSGMTLVANVSASSVKNDTYYQMITTGSSVSKSITYASNEDITCIAICIDVVP